MFIIHILDMKLFTSQVLFCNQETFYHKKKIKSLILRKLGEKKEMLLYNSTQYAYLGINIGG